tara:strand:- start:162 stop:566 length:405 start_codon:yes stop_codon:yes gene_type:complete
MEPLTLTIFLNLSLFVYMMVLNGRYKKLPKPVLKLPLTSSLSQLEASGLSLVMAKFRKGELVVLTAFGRILCVEQNNASVGIIMSEPRSYCLKEDGETMMYWVYDVFVGNELIIDIPQNFMIKVKNNENEENID